MKEEKESLMYLMDKIVHLREEVQRTFTDTEQTLAKTQRL